MGGYLGGQCHQSPAVWCLQFRCGMFENGMSWGNPSQTGLMECKKYSPTFEAGFRIGLTAAPTVVTVPVLNSVASATLITSFGAKLAGEVAADSGGAVTGRGIVHALASSNSNPSLGGTAVVELAAAGTAGTFDVDVRGLLAERSYAFRAYTTKSACTTSSDAVTFTTLAAPTLSRSETWHQRHFDNAADLATPDGVTNLMKYALGLTPRQRGAADLPKAKIATNSGSRYLSLGFRHGPSRNDVTIVVEVQGAFGGPGRKSSAAPTARPSPAPPPTASCGCRFINKPASRIRC
jgi:hypothetical protein